MTFSMDLAALCDSYIYGVEIDTTGCHLAVITFDRAFACQFMAAQHSHLPPLHTVSACGID